MSLQYLFSAAPVLAQPSRYVAGLMEAYFLLVMAPVLPLQEQQMTGTATTLRLLTPRRLATCPVARFGCLLIAAAENTYYSRVSGKHMASR